MLFVGAARIKKLELFWCDIKAEFFGDFRDGTLQGPNLEMLGHLKTHSGCDIVASGGVHDLEDIRRLSDMDLYGAIIGKALYTGDISLKAAIETARRHI